MSTLRDGGPPDRLGRVSGRKGVFGSTALMMNNLGSKRWAIADHYIPAWSHGREPEMTSHDAVCILNPGERDASVTMMVFFVDREPVGPYRFHVSARRTKHVRLNDLTEPEPLPRGQGFSSVIESTEPVVVQHTRLDSRQAENGLFSTVAFAGGA